MTKTFCDRCKVEVKHRFSSVHLKEYESEVDSKNIDMLLCPDCATALRAWLGDKKDE